MKLVCGTNLFPDLSSRIIVECIVVKTAPHSPRRYKLNLRMKSFSLDESGEHFISNRLPRSHAPSTHSASQGSSYSQCTDKFSQRDPTLLIFFPPLFPLFISLFILFQNEFLFQLFVSFSIFSISSEIFILSFPIAFIAHINFKLSRGLKTFLVSNRSHCSMVNQ